MVEKTPNNDSLSREKAFLILAGLLAVVAFLIYGLFPDQAKTPEIPSSSLGSKIQTYDQLISLGQDLSGNGQPAWREIVFGDKTKSGDNSTTSNLTTILARDTMAIGVLSNKNTDVNADLYMSALVDSASQQITVKDVGQINVSNDNSRAALKEYGNNAAVVFGMFFGNEQKELKDLQNYINTNNASNLNNIKSLQKQIQSLCTSFKTVAAPKNIATLHRTLLEQCFYYNDILTAFTKVDSDPSSSLVAVGQYQGMINNQTELLNKMRDFFDSNNVVFGVSDYGRIFNKNI